MAARRYDVSEIRSVLAKATPAPWATRTTSHDWYGESAQLVSAQADLSSPWGFDRDLTFADAHLIVLLRNSVEALLDELEELRGQADPAV